MKVFLTATSLAPDYGGPAFSVSALASALADVGVDVGLWAADGSAVATPLLPKSTTVQRFGGAESDALMRFGSADLIHDNGIWLPHNHRLAVLAEKRGIPRVVSIRGMLEPWAFRHKRAKKRIAWWLYQRRDLTQAQCHITTGEAESQNLRRLGLGVPISIIPNGVDVPDKPPRQNEMELQRDDRRPLRTALFLGRIYPVKGLPMLVEAWARVRPDGWSLRVAGPDEAGHRKQVETGSIGRRLRECHFLHRSRRTSYEEFRVLRRRPFCVADPFGKLWDGRCRGACSRSAGPDNHWRPWSILQERGCGWWVPPTVDGIANGSSPSNELGFGNTPMHG